MKKNRTCTMFVQLDFRCLMLLCILKASSGSIVVTKRGSHCYWTVDDVIASDFSDTFTQCQQQGGQPFIFASLEEALSITAALHVDTVEVYVPAIQINSSYYWFSVHPYDNGSIYSQTFFSDDVIDRDVRSKDCVILDASRFEAEACTSGFRFVCQKDLNLTKNDICDIFNATSEKPAILTSTAVATTMSSDQSRLTTAIADPGPGMDNSSAQCVPKDDGSCIPFTDVLLDVFSNLKKGTLDELLNNTGTDLNQIFLGRLGLQSLGEQTPWSILRLLKADRNRTDLTTDTINSVDVSNLTHSEAESALDAVYQFLLADNSTDEGLDDRVAALFFKMVDVPFMDDDILTTYVKGTALIIYGEEQKPEKKGVKKSQGTRILQAMERVLGKTNTSVHDQQLDEIVVRVTNVNMTHTSDDVTLSSRIDEKKNVIHLSRSLFPEGKGSVSTVVYKNLHRMLPTNRKGALKGGKVSSHVISIVVHPGIQQGEGHPHRQFADYAVNYTLPFLGPEKLDMKARRWCVYWKFFMRVWSDDGCWRIEANQTHTTCTCSHLSTFAVLVTFTKTPPLSENNIRAMFVLTAIGCSLSIAGLALTLITYIYLRIVLRQRIFIHANLALSLLLAQTVFIASDTAHNYEVACKVVAGLLHFFFMASFAWMLVEGLSLYRACTRGVLLYSSDLRLRYCLLGWGLPLLIVTISVGLEFPDYGRGLDNSCSLSLEEGLIWAFLAPMLLIVCVNVVILGMVLHVFLTLKANSKKSEADRVRAGVRAMGMLLPLLGTTWLLSVLVPVSAVFSYLFILCNSLQGLVIFLLHCVGNEEVRRFLARKRLTTRSRTSESNLSVVAWRRRSPVVNFDDVKLGMACEGQLSGHEGRRNAWV